MRPLIGLTTSEVRLAERVEQTAQGEPPQREMALGMTYLAAIEAAGGLPVVIPPLQPGSFAAMLERLDGICLSGGPDLDPALYRRDRHAELGPVDPQLDRIEIELARCADAAGLPMLAICRGQQTLNVVRGGTLVQHLPDQPGITIEHRQRLPADQPTHDVSVEADSRLAWLMGRTAVRVNSFHHQAIDGLGAGLHAVAWSPDGVIEAVECGTREFAVGVQWHAETLVDRAENAALFSRLVEAATKRRRGSALAA